MYRQPVSLVLLFMIPKYAIEAADGRSYVLLYVSEYNMSSRRKKDVLYLKILNTVMISKNGKGELMIIETNSEKETWDLGFSLGEKACAGQVYTLVGDLGVGKTIFTKGLAKGLGIDEPVSSPTFTIVQIYDEGRLPFYHFDVYRIGDVEEMDEIGYEDYIYGEGVSLIEWANLIEEILPEHYTEIKIEKDLEKGFDYRRITICEY